MNKLDVDTIPSYNKFDYFLTFGKIFLLNNNPKKAKELYQKLKELKHENLENKALKIYSDKLIECYEHFKENTEIKSSRILKIINSIIDLKPNIFGIGINFNALINHILNLKK